MLEPNRVTEPLVENQCTSAVYWVMWVARVHVSACPLAVTDVVYDQKHNLGPGSRAGLPDCADLGLELVGPSLACHSC